MASSGSPWGSITTATASSSWSKVFGAYQLHWPEPMHRSRSTRISRLAGEVMRSASRGEVEGERPQAAEHEGAHVLVAAVSGRTVRLFVDPDVGGAVEEPLDRDAGL